MHSVVHQLPQALAPHYPAVRNWPVPSQHPYNRLLRLDGSRNRPRRCARAIFLQMELLLFGSLAMFYIWYVTIAPVMSNFKRSFVS